MIQLISVHDIISSTKKTKDKSKLQKVKNIITRFGQFKMVILNKVGDQYFLVAGHIILQALKELDEPFVNCYVFQELNQDEINAIYLVDNSPKDVDVLDNARRIEEMIDPRQVDRLSNILPFSRKELRNFADLKKFNWGDYDNNEKHYQTSLFN